MPLRARNKVPIHPSDPFLRNSNARAAFSISIRLNPSAGKVDEIQGCGRRQERTFVLILDQAEEAFQAVAKFADQEDITGASVTAIGAFERAKVGWFDFERKHYKPISVTEQCEVLSLLGDIAQGGDGKASLHLHAVLGLSDGSVRGGHLLEGSFVQRLKSPLLRPQRICSAKSIRIGDRAY